MFKKGDIPWNKGLKGFNKGHPAYMKAVGKDNPFFGKKRSDETKNKMKLAKLGKRGNETNNWQGGSSSKQYERKSADYAIWRVNILKRDDYYCQECGHKSTDLNVHHIDSFSDYPNKRLNMDNGITLCKDCHFHIHQKIRIYGEGI